MDGGAERLAELLADLCRQLEAGHRRAQEALAEVRTCGATGPMQKPGLSASPEKPRGLAAERAEEPPQPPAGGRKEEPHLTLPAGCFPQRAGRSDCAPEVAPQDRASLPDAVPHAERRARDLATWSSTLTPPVEDGPDSGDSCEGSPQARRGQEPCRRPAKTPGASPMAGRSPFSRRPERLHRRQGSFSSMMSATWSVFGCSNASMEPESSDSRAASAMDMIAHDSIRSWDLKSFWRSTSPSRTTSRRASLDDLPWPVREWLSRFDWRPSLARRRARALVSSARYEVSVMLLIIANSIFLGYQVEHEAYTRQQLHNTFEIEALFCLAFTFELAVKIYALGWHFLMGSGASWNYFDIFVVASMLLDFCVSLSEQTTEPSSWSHVSGLRILRVLRVIRFLRSVRQLKVFSQLRIMVRSIMYSLRPLLWATIILLGMFYAFGIILTQGVTDSLKTNDSWEDESSASLRYYFGTLEDSALSMFQAMSGGINWGVLFETLSPLPVHFRFVFLFFVLFAIFGAANVVTGIFVEIANHWALNDKASREQAATEKRHSSLKRLYHLFNDMDPGGHGTLTLEGMHEALLDENSHLVSSFHALELEVTDVRTLFLLLDRDRKGFINLEEFLLGCFRLKGEARTLDIMKLQYQCEFIMHNLVNISDVLTRRDACDTWGAAPSPRGSGADTPAGAHTDFRNFSAAVVRQQLGEVLRKSGSAAQSSAAASLTNTSRDGSESPAPRALRNQMSQLSLGSLV